MSSGETVARFAYFGTPGFSIFVLEELAAAGYLPTLVVTTPDKPAGRGLALSESPVNQWAKKHAIPLLQPERFDEGACAALRAAQLDFCIVAAYGKILPSMVLEIPPRGALNVHPSLLPRYRGTSPVESQILADEKDIGVSVIVMDEKMDHGPVLAQEKISLPEWPLARSTLNGLLWRTGGTLLATTLRPWLAGEIIPQAQEESAATFTKKIKKEDGEIDLAGDARTNYLKYLAYEGWPGTYFFENNKRIKITQAAFRGGGFVVERVIPEGGKETSYRPGGYS